MSQGMVGKKRRGPAPLPPDQGKRHPIGIRVTKEIRAFLQQMADSSGRSLAQEIELRLQRSVDFDAILGGARPAALFRALAASVVIQFGTSDRWLDDSEKFERVQRLLEEGIAAHAPGKRSAR
jgi:hypothetical protein